jgi:hypothetical protein
MLDVFLPPPASSLSLLMDISVSTDGRLQSSCSHTNTTLVPKKNLTSSAFSRENNKLYL